MAALKKTDLPTSVSPAIVFFLKQLLATATCHSSTYALVFRTKMKIHAATYYIWFSFSIFPIAFGMIVGESFASYSPIIYSLFNISVVISYFMPAAAIKENWMFTTLKKLMKKNGKVIEFSIGMAGTILFQNFLPSTSFDHVVAFLFLAVAWLANLALLLCPHDFGIFNFLVGNVIVGCTVGQFRLRNSTSWIAYAASLLLYILRLKLELVSVVDRGEAKAAVVAWGESQITVGVLLPCFQ